MKRVFLPMSFLQPAPPPPTAGRIMSPAATPGGQPAMDDAGTPPPVPDGDLHDTPEATIELVNRARAGERAALDALFTRYEVRLRRWAHGRLPVSARGAMDTQDLVQETLAHVFQRLGDFEPRHPGAFRDYVWTTLVEPDPRHRPHPGAARAVVTRR